MAESPAVETSDHPTLSCTTQCCSEVNNVPEASQQLVIVTYKVARSKYEHGELVIGKNNCVPLHFLDSFKMVKSTYEQGQSTYEKAQ